MAKKKKGSKKSSKAKRGKSLSNSSNNRFESVWDFHTRHEKLSNRNNQPNWVRLQLRVLHWDQLLIELLLRSDSSMHSIARRIEQSTGSLTHLRLFTSSAHDSIEIGDWNTTIADCGYNGAFPEDPQQAQLFCDFSPRVNDPILLAEPASWSFGSTSANRAELKNIMCKPEPKEISLAINSSQRHTETEHVSKNYQDTENEGKISC